MYRTLLRIIVLLLLISVKSYSQCSTTNVATGAPYGAIGIAGHDSAKYAFDNNASTYWEFDNVSSQEIGIDLGRDVAICSIELTWGSTAYASGYVVRASSDWNHWYSSTAIPHSASGTDTFYFPNNPLNTYRIVEVYIYGQVSGQPGVKLYNFAVHQAAASNNLPPVVNLTAPANNATYQLGHTVNMKATASDPDGGIQRVEFFQGTTNLGQSTSSGSPYSFDWTPSAAGTYSFTAKATDNAGGSTTTTAVSVTVSASTDFGWSLTGNGGTTPANQFIGTTDAQPMIFKTNNTEQFRIGTDGHVKIGSFANAPTDAKLAVDGYIYARKLTVTSASWADFVFKKNYSLLTLPKVESYIKTFGHLPGVPSEATIQKTGISVGDNQAILLKKIEELTLYLIEQNKKISRLEEQVKNQERKNRNLSGHR